MGSTHLFQLKDEPIENLRPLKVRVIGAGYSGIYLGIRIPQRLRNVDLQIYEKNEDIGGTWWENTYPGTYYDFQCLIRTNGVDRLRLRYPISFLPILLQSKPELVCLLCSC